MSDTPAGLRSSALSQQSTSANAELLISNRGPRVISSEPVPARRSSVSSRGGGGRRLSSASSTNSDPPSDRLMASTASSRGGKAGGGGGGGGGGRRAAPRPAASRIKSSGGAKSTGTSRSWQGSLRTAQFPGRSHLSRTHSDGMYDDSALFSCIDMLRDQITQIQDAFDDGEDRWQGAVRDVAADLEDGLRSAADDVGNLSARIDNRFDQTDEWLNQMEAKIERTEAASIELHNEVQGNVAADVSSLDEKLDEVTAQHMRAMEEMLTDQVDTMRQQVETNSSDTDQHKQLVHQVRQDHAAHEAAISERVDHNSSTLRQHEEQFAKVEQMDATIRKFSERLQQMDENENRRLRVVERDVRDSVERVEQLHAKMTSDEKHFPSAGGEAASPGGAASPSVPTPAAAAAVDPAVLDEISALRRGLEQQTVDLNAHQTVSLEATRRLQQQLTKLEIGAEDTNHNIKTAQKDSKFEIDSLGDLLAMLQQRVAEAAAEVPRARDRVVANPESPAVMGQLSALLERVACVEQMAKLDQQQGRTVASAQAEQQERIVRMEHSVAKSTRLCEADVSNVTDRIRLLEDSVRSGGLGGAGHGGGEAGASSSPVSAAGIWEKLSHFEADMVMVKSSLAQASELRGRMDGWERSYSYGQEAGISRSTSPTSGGGGGGGGGLDIVTEAANVGGGDVSSRLDAIEAAAKEGAARLEQENHNTKSSLLKVLIQVRGPGLQLGTFAPSHVI
eukprot:SAG22_NODE_16_length_32723_cov_26.404825_38_plen_733_part_00